MKIDSFLLEQLATVLSGAVKPEGEKGVFASILSRALAGETRAGAAAGEPVIEAFFELPENIASGDAAEGEILPDHPDALMKLFGLANGSLPADPAQASGEKVKEDSSAEGQRYEGPFGDRDHSAALKMTEKGPIGLTAPLIGEEQKNDQDGARIPEQNTKAKAWPDAQNIPAFRLPAGENAGNNAQVQEQSLFASKIMQGSAEKAVAAAGENHAVKEAGTGSGSKPAPDDLHLSQQVEFAKSDYPQNRTEGAKQIAAGLSERVEGEPAGDGALKKTTFANAFGPDQSALRQEQQENTAGTSLKNSLPDLKSSAAEVKNSFIQNTGEPANPGELYRQPGTQLDQVLQETRIPQPQASGMRESLMQQLEGRLVYMRETANFPAEMRLNLHPPELGEVTIRIVSRQGKLSASIIAESTAVKEILESSIAELRQRLNYLNIQFEQLDVSTAGKEPGGSGRSSGGQDTDPLYQGDRKSTGNDDQGAELNLPASMPPGGENAVDYWA